jgi:NDP-sugar pyrophosphorylase family protein
VTLPVAILAGGLGTRLGSVTNDIPKSLVDVAGEPFILRQLRYLGSQGVGTVVLCVGHLGDQIQAVVGSGPLFGLSVRYSWDGAVRQGTGGALVAALPELGSTFFVCYGDSYLPIDFKEVERAFRRSRAPALMTVLRNRQQWDQSNAVFRDGLVTEYDKKTPREDMEYIDYGLAVLSASALLDPIRTPPFDLADVYQDLSRAGRLAGHEVQQRFYEIGSPQGLTETAEYFLEMERS